MWGGSGGSLWSTKDASRILKIKIQHGHTIDAISFESDNSNGTSTWSPVNGGPGGETAMVRFLKLEGNSNFTCSLKEFLVVVSIMLARSISTLHDPYTKLYQILCGNIAK